MKRAEDDIVRLQAEAIRLEKVKTDLSLFKVHKKKQELKNIEHDVKLFKCSNHVLSHDNFYEKYIPIRM